MIHVVLADSRGPRPWLGPVLGSIFKRFWFDPGSIFDQLAIRNLLKLSRRRFEFQHHIRHRALVAHGACSQALHVRLFQLELRFLKFLKGTTWVRL